MSVLKIAGMLLIAAVSMVLNGWGLSILWDWFIASKFSLPPLGVAEAIGVCSVVGYMTKQVIKDNRSFIEQASTQIAKPFVFLAIGWIVLKFI